MRLAFMGTPDFAVPALLALHQAGHEIVAVYTQPPKPAGRGQRETRSPVHQAADRLKIPVRTPARLRGNREEAEFFSALGLDAAIVAAYGLILPREFLDAPRRGCINIHASLLPRWRGAAPIQAAILAGDAETGVTIMQMDDGLDTGPILLAQPVPLHPASTAASIHDELATLGAKLLLRALAEHPTPISQPDGATYAPKLSRADALIDWTASAETIERHIRAFTPWPGTETTLGAERIKILGGVVTEVEGEPGIAADDRLTIGCGVKSLKIIRLQRAGKAALGAAEFLRGHPVPAGTRLG